MMIGNLMTNSREEEMIPGVKIRKKEEFGSAARNFSLNQQKEITNWAVTINKKSNNLKKTLDVGREDGIVGEGTGDDDQHHLSHGSGLEGGDGYAVDLVAGSSNAGGGAILFSDLK